MLVLPLTSCAHSILYYIYGCNVPGIFPSHREYALKGCAPNLTELTVPGFNLLPLSKLLDSTIFADGLWCHLHRVVVRTEITRYLLSVYQTIRASPYCACLCVCPTTLLPLLFSHPLIACLFLTILCILFFSIMTFISVPFYSIVIHYKVFFSQLKKLFAFLNESFSSFLLYFMIKLTLDDI